MRKSLAAVPRGFRGPKPRVAWRLARPPSRHAAQELGSRLQSHASTVGTAHSGAAPPPISGAPAAAAVAGIGGGTVLELAHEVLMSELRQGLVKQRSEGSAEAVPGAASPANTATTQVGADATHVTACESGRRIGK